MTVKELRELLNHLTYVDGMEDREIQVVVYDGKSTEGVRFSTASVVIGDDYVALDPFESPAG